jgi:DNA replication protein DnaC
VRATSTPSQTPASPSVTVPPPPADAFVTISRQDHIALKSAANYWQTLHRRAVERFQWCELRYQSILRELEATACKSNAALQAELDLARGQVRDLQKRLFAGKSERHKHCENQTGAATFRRPQGQQHGSSAGRGLERKAVMSLALGDWVASGHIALITGPTGVGKSWLACALAQYACRRGHSAFYQRVPRLSEELRIRHGIGTIGNWLLQLAKTDVLLLDDWGMAGIDSQTRADLLEIIDDRVANKATISTSQLPIDHWHAWIGDATMADAMVDHLMQRHHCFTLMGDSLL